MTGFPPPETWGVYDRKALNLVAHHSSRIRENVFDETDVALLLILLRNWTHPHSVLGEFAGFIAHRVRNKGAFHRRLMEIWQRIDREGDQAASEHDLYAFEPIYSPGQIGSELDAVLNNLGLEPIPERLYSDITLCVMSLVQDTVFQQDGVPFGFFVMLHDSTTAYCLVLLRFSNRSIGIPVLKVDGSPLKWDTIGLEDTPGKVFGKQPINGYSIRRVDGKLEQVELETPPPFPRIRPKWK